VSFPNPPRTYSDGRLAPEEGSPVGRDPAVTSSDAITPELALVSPDLAETARRGLLDRPSALSVERSAVRTPSREEPAVPVKRTNWRHVLGALLLAALVMGGAVPGGSRREGREIASGAEDPQPLLLPSSGYVVSQGGSFMTDATGRRIELFTLPIVCGSRQLVIADVPVSRSFRFTGKAVGRAITVRLRAQLLDRERVRGVVVVSGASCSAGPVEFSARLS
jgi:hypothetical protein